MIAGLKIVAAKMNGAGRIRTETINRGDGQIPTSKIAIDVAISPPNERIRVCILLAGSSGINSHSLTLVWNQGPIGLLLSPGSNSTGPVSRPPLVVKVCSIVARSLESTTKTSAFGNASP